MNEFDSAAISELGYPEARRLDLTEDVLGHRVSDPYRWLEEAGSAERAEWLRAQADLFGSQREELPGRDDLAGQVRALLSVGTAIRRHLRLTTPVHQRPAQEAR